MRTVKGKIPISNQEDVNFDIDIRISYIYHNSYDFNHSLVEYVVREPQHLLRS